VTLPLLISVPHAGRRVPPEVGNRCLLSETQLLRDGDEGAEEIYAVADGVAAYVTTEVARAIVDLNRAPDDIRPDGVVKTETCFEEPVYEEPLDDATIEALLRHHYHPYHQRLSEAARPPVRLGIDCHTMLAVGPPIGPGAGLARPRICLGNAEGTCPELWLESLARCLRAEFGDDVALNEPFRGGYIIRSHAHELPWVQLEMSRAPFASPREKRRRLLVALRRWCGECLPRRD